MAEGNDQEKSEPATPKKRADARRKGQIAKSREIPSVAVLLTALSFFYFGGGWMFSQLIDLTGDVLQRIGQPGTIESMHHLLGYLFKRIAVILTPLLLVIIMAGIAGNVIQSGFLLTGEPMIPKLSKLNPLTGMKRLFSVRALVELLKSVTKVIIVGTVAYSILRAEMDQIPAMIALSTTEILSFLGGVTLKIGFYTCLVLLVLAALDFVFQHWKHERDLRMSKQDVKDEYKQREGDPLLRSRIRAAQREMAMRRMMQAVPEATVVITNPTHLAVALKFDRSMPAPRVLAKGAGEIAERIKTLAEQHGIPIIEQKPLARALFKNVEIDEYIPADLYHAVAEILAYVYRLKGMAG
jgi:flagellar biosynthesis protein FlhB